MKIRNGYVSNSSSSSFVIKAEGDLSTVKDVAEYIMKTYNETYEENSDIFNNELEVLNSQSDPNIPVFFNTGGDETYIRKFGDKIVLVTTQNINFYDLKNAALRSNDIDKEFFEQFNYFDEEDQEEMIFTEPYDLDYFYKNYDDFLMLYENIYGREEYISNCPLCKEQFVTGYILQKYGKICSCQLPKIKTILARKYKLNKLNNENT